MSITSKPIRDLSPEEKRALLAQLVRKKVSKPKSVPVSFAQQRLWLLDQLVPGNPFYNIPAAIRLTFPLNVAALEQSLNEIVRRHEALRTTFAVVDGKPVQVIAPSLTMLLPVLDLRTLPQSEREAESLRLATEESRRPFDLAHGPLVRTTLLRLDEADHVFLLTMHHIVCDGWSMGVFSRELAALYTAFARGRPSPLPELPIQYADFAVWQRQRLQGEVLEEQLAYWKQQLADLPVLQLPTDRPRPPVSTFRGAQQNVALSKSLTEALKALSQREEVTLFMILLAAFKTLLARYAGQDDIVVGAPIANRNRAEIEGLIGFFVNTLVMRTDLSGDPSFREVLGRVREVALGAYAHQDLPFEMLVEELQPQRDLSRNPLCQIMFQLQNTPSITQQTQSLNPPSLEIKSGTAKFDVTFDLWESPQGLSGQFEYNTDFFDASTIERMAGHFQTLLEGIVVNPEQRLSELPLLTEAERQQLLVAWNATQADYSKETCIHQLFEAQVARTPEAVAVVFEGERLTYRELNRRANQVAHHLQRLGVGPEVLVGICVERSLEMVVGLLGILKAGGAYIPLDPAYPKERLAFMLEDTQTPVLVTQQRLVTGLPEQGAQVVRLDADWEVIAAEGQENPVSAVTANNLAYVIYTSGSTGRPKGVMISHYAICNHMFWMLSAFPLTEADGVVQRTPFSFDASIWEFYAPLLAGARLVMLRPQEYQDSADLVKVIAKHKVTTLQLIPTLLRVFLEEQGLETCNCLRRVFCGGEALTVELQDRFFARLDADLHNLYGPTEASIDTTFWPCNGESSQQVVPIGHPIANMQAYVLDRSLQPVPIGVAGELYIGGAGLARGYLNRFELTAEKFIPNPFSDEPGARLYKTGDLVRHLPDGNVDFLGRIDHQVKLRGFRIELGEVEAVLRQYAGVQEVTILAREDVPDDQRLVAYVVPNQVPAPAIGEMRRFLKERLPEYMIPSAFVLLDVLPLTPNGKVDRPALPMPNTARPELEGAYVAPRSEVERTIATLWQEVLHLAKVGIHDNFFDIGGHSLLMVRVYSKLREALNKGLSMIDLFRYPTVSSLAKYLSQEQNEQPSFRQAHDRAKRQTEAINRRRQMIKGGQSE
jgi:amino acid adenylation domain-containing protein